MVAMILTYLPYEGSYHHDHSISVESRYVAVTTYIVGVQIIKNYFPKNLSNIIALASEVMALLVFEAKVRQVTIEDEERGFHRFLTKGIACCICLRCAAVLTTTLLFENSL